MKKSPPHRWIPLWLLCGTVLWAALASAQAAEAANPTEFFENKIRPVLVEHCYKCHSEKSEKLKAGLLVDTKAGLLKGGESGKPAVVPGNPEKSLLIEAIRFADPDLQMPPKKKLSDAQVQDFEKWVLMGAPDPRTETARKPVVDATHHWAFQPVVKPPVPAVRNDKWVRTPIDAFILARLTTNGLAPSPAADKRTLIRRATVDLTGLPPTQAEVDAFLRDKSRDSWEKLVDRLLASPRYGERWGRYWLDVARYADTKGYVYTDREEPRFVHSYAFRDWVIRSLNSDLPYDRFLLLQLAADQKEVGASPEDLAAMGYLTLGRRFLGVVHDIIDDRLDVVLRGTQGLTIGCARCHDHKFDPIPTRDYYSLYGVFNGCTERMQALPAAPGEAKDTESFTKGLKERTDKYDETLRKKREHFANQFRDKCADYLVASLDVKRLPSEEFYEIRGPDDLNPFIARTWDNYLNQTRKAFHPVLAYWHQVSEAPGANFATEAAKVLETLTAAGVTNRLNPLVAEVFKAKPPASMKEVALGYGKLLTATHQQWRGLVEAATTNKTALPTALADRDAEQVRQVLYATGSPVVVPELSAVDLEWYFDEGARVELMKLHSEIERWIIKSSNSPPYAVVLEDRPNQKNARVFVRGNPANKGEEAPRQFLQLLSGPARQPFSKGSGRLEMAQAIACRTNPLTARVMVNRVWLEHFGAGLVRTPSDFGTRSEPPTHPELLDWLSSYFMDEGWSLKKLHRLILLSSVYQQSSDTEPERRRAIASVGKNAQDPQLADPENKLLWRMNRQRMDFETMRDSLLAASGELDPKSGGKPEELFGAQPSKRRSVYGYLDRQFLPNVLRVFDFANPDMHSPQRAATTVPQQALFFMNNPFVAERSRSMLLRPEIASAAGDERRVEQLYRAAYQRPPNAAEKARALRFIQEAKAEPQFEPAPPPSPVWFYGYGELAATNGPIKGFTPLPHYTGDAWQGGEAYPDGKLGWLKLTAEGGHTGNDLQHSVVRRWIAPTNLTISISGTVKHEHKEGDGVVAGIVASRQGLLGKWTVHNSKADAKVESLEVQAGDTVDFFVSLHRSLNNNDFVWNPVIKSVKTSAGLEAREWNAKKDFGGTLPAPPKPLNAWEKLAQALLLSNEFVFVD